MSLRSRLLTSLSAAKPGAQRAASGDAVSALRETWSRYPSEWSQDPKLNLGAATLGEEWGGPAFADHLVELVAEYLGQTVDVLELGCGGGKFSQRLASRCRSLLCTDISPAMIDHTRESLSRQGLEGNVRFLVLNGIDFSGVPDASVDFVFSYDVLLHLQPQNVFSYMLDARRILRGDGVFMLHQINLASTGGMQHFLGQYSGQTWRYGFEDPRRRGHIYFMGEDQLRALAEQAGLVVERVVTDHGDFDGVTSGRDIVAFLRRRRSRLRDAQGEVALVKARDSATIYALLDGRRHAISNAGQFERAGLRWDRVRELGDGELAAIPDGGPLEAWE